MASVFQMLPLLRQAAPRLSRRFFTCPVSRNPSSLCSALLSKRSQPLRTFRSRNRHASTANSPGPSGPLNSASPLSSLSKTIEGTKTKEKFFPEISEKIVAYWLLGSAASVFGLVVFGGLTRLTESGYISGFPLH